MSFFFNVAKANCIETQKKRRKEEKKGFIKERAIVSHPGVDGESCQPRFPLEYSTQKRNLHSVNTYFFQQPVLFQHEFIGLQGQEIEHR